jgi:hypothetical protein
MDGHSHKRRKQAHPWILVANTRIGEKTAQPMTILVTSADCGHFLVNHWQEDKESSLTNDNPCYNCRLRPFSCKPIARGQRKQSNQWQSLLQVPKAGSSTWTYNFLKLAGQDTNTTKIHKLLRHLLCFLLYNLFFSPSYFCLFKRG